MNVYKTRSIKITYGQLNNVLTSLGFEPRETEEFTAYREADHGALIILPRMSPETVVGDPHLEAVRHTVIWKGVATRDELEALLTPSSAANGNREQAVHHRAASGSDAMDSPNNEQTTGLDEQAQKGTTLTTGDKLALGGICVAILALIVQILAWLTPPDTFRGWIGGAIRWVVHPIFIPLWLAIIVILMLIGATMNVGGILKRLAITPAGKHVYPLRDADTDLIGATFKTGGQIKASRRFAQRQLLALTCILYFVVLLFLVGYSGYGLFHFRQLPEQVGNPPVSPTRIPMIEPYPDNKPRPIEDTGDENAFSNGGGLFRNWYPLTAKRPYAEFQVRNNDPVKSISLVRVMVPNMDGSRHLIFYIKGPIPPLQDRDYRLDLRSMLDADTKNHYRVVAWSETDSH